MTTKERAIDLVKYYVDISRTRNLDDLDVICTPDFSNHSPKGTEGGLEKFKTFVSSVWDMVPDLQIEINTIFADKADDGEPWVGALVTLRGTIADNNQPLELPEFWLFQVSEGKLAERRYLVDRAKLSG